jgi:hypothetical protein
MQDPILKEGHGQEVFRNKELQSIFRSKGNKVSWVAQPVYS